MKEDAKSDDELLAIVAKKLGNLEHVADCGWIPIDENGNRGAWWNPLRRSDDAFWLLTTLKIGIRIDDAEVTAYISAPSYKEWTEILEVNPNAAVRRAIVRAAADIDVM